MIQYYNDMAESRRKEEKDYAPADPHKASAILHALITDATAVLQVFQEGDPKCPHRQSIVNQLTLLLEEAQDPTSVVGATLLAELSSTNPCTCRSAVCGLAALVYEDPAQQKTAHANAMLCANEHAGGIANNLSNDDLSEALNVPLATINAFYDAIRSTRDQEETGRERQACRQAGRVRQAGRQAEKCRQAGKTKTKTRTRKREGRREGGQEGRREGGKEGRRAGGKEGRRAGRKESKEGRRTSTTSASFCFANARNLQLLLRLRQQPLHGESSGLGFVSDVPAVRALPPGLVEDMLGLSSLDSKLLQLLCSYRRYRYRGTGTTRSSTGTTSTGTTKLPTS
eukprot:COSAG05_NODE_2982_length_2436_cov_4.558408_3_plen_341_part_00